MKCAHCNLEFDEKGIHVCLSQLAEKQAQKAIRTTPRIPAADGKSASFWVGRTPPSPGDRSYPDYVFLEREGTIGLTGRSYYWHGGGEMCTAMTKRQFETLTNGLTLEPGEIAEVTLHINKIKEAKLSTRAQRQKNPPKRKGKVFRVNDQPKTGVGTITMVLENGEWRIGT